MDSRRHPGTERSPLTARHERLPVDVGSFDNDPGGRSRYRPLVVLLAAAVAGGVAFVNYRLVQAIRGDRRRLDALLRPAHDIVVVLDGDGNATFVSSAVTGLLGYDASALVGRPLADLVHPGDARKLALAIGIARPRAASSIDDVRLRDPDGHYLWFDIDVTDLRGHREVSGMLLTCHESGDRKAFQDQLAYNGAHDTLTGLPNRTLFADHLEQLATADGAGPYAILFIDLDHFKAVNDTFGQAAGDEVLRTVAHRLQASIRSGGDDRRSDVVCRLGGDEFVVLLLDVTEDLARRAAERMLSIVRQPIPVEGTDLAISATIGVSLSHSGQEHPDVAVRAADSAMYRAKMAGRDQYEFCVD